MGFARILLSILFENTTNLSRLSDMSIYVRKSVIQINFGSAELNLRVRYYLSILRDSQILERIHCGRQRQIFLVPNEVDTTR